MATEKVYADGIILFKPRENSPEWVKGSLVIGIDVLMKWANDHPEHLTEYKGDRQLRLDVLDGKNGLYLAVNTYKKEGNAPVNNTATSTTKSSDKANTNIQETVDDLPF